MPCLVGVSKNFDFAVFNLPVVDNVKHELFDTERGTLETNQLFVLGEDIEKQSVVDAFIVAVLVDGVFGILQVEDLRFGDTVGRVGKFLRLLGEH